MKFSLSWLKQHLETTASLKEICDKLTALGLEVEGIEDHGKKLAPFIIAHVLEAKPHPNADRLKLCTVDTGKEKLQVVCGAPNARAGIKVVLARPGDVMPDTGEALKKSAIRGVESQGMLCAADELALGSDHEGIIELPEDAPLGGSFVSYGGYADPVIAINLTPNRPDCAGVFGIARDLAAAGMGKLKPLHIPAHKGSEASSIKVKLNFGASTKACPLFIGRVIKNIENRPSPDWLCKRLRAIGLRPISALVDITNYITFDCARPLHVFDAKKIKGNIWVAEAKGGEKLEALNDKSYTLEKGMTVVGDDTGVLGLGGVIGGVSSACDATTKDVFLEAAYFDPSRTALTGRQLQIVSDARYRFERGVDPLFTAPGIELATHMILELCGTKETIISTLEIAGEMKPKAEALSLDPKKCLKFTGIDISEKEQSDILTRLGFSVSHAGTRLSVIPPSWRPDIEGTADLIEEIIRLKGYEHLPSTSLSKKTFSSKAAIDVEDARTHIMRRALAEQGLMETVTWSFMPSPTAKLFGGENDHLRLLNPISSDLDMLRPSIFPNLLLAAKRNADRGFMNASLFEIGPVFKDQTPQGQILMATTLRTGQTPTHWATPSRPYDAYDAKGDAFAALAALGVVTDNIQITNDAPSWYHPGRSGSLRFGPTLLGTFGELHPSVGSDFSVPVIGSEIFVANIPLSRGGSAKPLLKTEVLQSLSRDFAFVVDRSTPAAALIKAAKNSDRNLVSDIKIFDVYEGDKIASDKKSIAISVTLQPSGKTMTDSEIEAFAAKLTAAVCKATGGTLRG